MENDTPIDGLNDILTDLFDLYTETIGDDCDSEIDALEVILENAENEESSFSESLADSEFSGFLGDSEREDGDLHYYPPRGPMSIFNDGTGDYIVIYEYFGFVEEYRETDGLLTTSERIALKEVEELSHCDIEE